MGLASFLKSLVPTITTDVDTEIKSIQTKATSDIAAAKARHVAATAATQKASDHAAVERAYVLAKQALNTPVVTAPVTGTGPTGTTGSV